MLKRLTLLSSSVVGVWFLSQTLFLHQAHAFTEDPNRFFRNSDPQIPEAELKGFHVPEGFEVQLFADDTQLGGKPINMAFDARGRLWVTCTQEYPFAVKKDKWSADTTSAPGSKDTIRILEDTDGDGRADKVTVFATDLNIPTGVLPYKNGCIAWSIPNILYLEDTNGDGKADKRSILFGPLGYEKDTHGMISSFRMGLDGWVYATHGFSNTSHFAVRPEHKKSTTEGTEHTEKDGTKKPSVTSVPSVVKNESFDVTSGSVFRFKPDGSQVELWTSGQVNPFGLCWDSWGNLYSADCHSAPIYQLIRGACYPSFGKPHDGLGFGPVMCEHAHGSTGICGPIYIDGGIWGQEWDDHMFVCNPVTSKINHDFITFTGSTPKANEKPDFLTSDDLWFHPVDLQLGPDSALYIADFYNRIIGHYEVPLDHPGRDRKSGRIWRVVKKGSSGKLVECDLGKTKPGELVESMGDRNITKRNLATHQFVSIGKEHTRLIHDIYKSDESSLRRASGLWALYNLGDDMQLGSLPGFLAYQNKGKDITQNRFDRHALVAAHALKIAADRGDAWGWNSISLLPGLMQPEAVGVTTNPRLRAEAFKAGALISRLKARTDEVNPQYDLGLLIPALAEIDPEDTHLRFALRKSIAEVMRLPLAFKALETYSVKPIGRALHDFIEIVQTIPSADAANWLLDQVKASASANSGNVLKPALEMDRALLIQTLTHIARYLPAERQGELVDLVQKHFGEGIDTQLDLFNAIAAGSATLRSRLSNETKERALSEATTESRAPSKSLRAWAEILAQRLADALDTKTDSDWSQVSSTNPQSASPWFRQMRKCEDGTERPFLCSLPPGGEKLTGLIRSKAFDLPNTFFFWIAGHRGLPGGPAHEKNFVQLVDEATGAVVAKAFPPCHDTAVSVTWELSETESKRGHLELVDGDSGTAYAWLAVGGFSPQVVDVPDLNGLPNDKHIRAAAELARIWETHEDASASLKKHSAPAFPDLAKRLNALPHREAYAADTRVALARLCMMSLFMPQEVPELARDADLAVTVFKVLEDNNEHSNLAAAFKTLPSRPQIKLASALATSLDSAKLLLKFAAPTVLADPLVSGKLNALDDPEITKQLKAATESLPPQNEALNKLIALRLKSFDPAKANPSRGQDSFMRNCSVCHRIGVKGNLVGPQLDGVGARGAERLIEDIMDPNRAVDPAFRLHILKLKSGGLMTGLLRREQDDELVFADTAGQEHTVKKADVAEEQVSPFSLMPSGFGEILPEQELHDLMAFLLERKS